MKKFRPKIIEKINAGALYYAVFISFIISLISGSLILYTFLYNSYVDRQVLQDQVRSNVQSGINSVLKNPEQVAYNSTADIKLFNHDVNVALITKKHWGAYDLLIASSKRHIYNDSKIAFIGDHLGKKEDIALYLTDQKKYLSISGKTLLKGTCYLPKLGIKRAYIEGQGYQNRELVYGTIQQSESKLPGLNHEKIKYLEELITRGVTKNDSVMELTPQLANQEIQNSFYNKPLILFSDQIKRLNGLRVSGNVILRFDQQILINANCKLQDIIIIAPSVVIQEAFSGKVQIFASDKIVIEKSCKLMYPSFLGVVKSKEDEEFAVSIGENSMVAGGVLLYSSMASTKNPFKMKINTNASIYGLVYCEGYVEHKGSIYGSLYCNGFTLKTAASLYENHLLSATINYQKLPDQFVGVNLVDKPINEQIIKWVD